MIILSHNTELFKWLLKLADHAGYEVAEFEDEPASPPETFLEELPTANEALGIPAETREVIYESPHRLVHDAIDRREVIGFEYTSDKGFYSGFRVVEPHYTYLPRTTRREVLVGFDREVGDIRAFIVGNIHPGGVRYDGVKFTPRRSILRGLV